MYSDIRPMPVRPAINKSALARDWQVKYLKQQEYLCLLRYRATICSYPAVAFQLRFIQRTLRFGKKSGAKC